MSYSLLRTIFSREQKLYPGLIEVQLGPGLVHTEIMGLAKSSLLESPYRVKAAFAKIGLKYPKRKVLVSCLPANWSKEGSHYDLALAVLIAMANGDLPRENMFSKALILGGLSLAGELQTFPNIDKYLLKAREYGFLDVIIPAQALPLTGDLKEELGEMRIWAVANLNDCFNLLLGAGEKACSKEAIFAADNTIEDSQRKLRKIAYIPEQVEAWESLALAIAGWHPLLILGSPGSGKTLIGESAPLLQAKISSIDLGCEPAMNILNEHNFNKRASRFLSCHHSVSQAALIGGGSPIKPGLVSHAHKGTLFLDELCEFSSSKLNLLRQCLSSGKIDLARGEEQRSFDTDFLLLAAANPCPCGYYLEAEHTCSCTRDRVARYLGKISGPLWDRFQILVTLQGSQPEDAANTYEEKAFTAGQNLLLNLRDKIKTAIVMQIERAAHFGLKEFRNGKQEGENLKKIFLFTAEAEKTLNRVIGLSPISNRRLLNLMSLARTLADLAEEEKVTPEDVHLALSYYPGLSFNNREAII